MRLSAKQFRSLVNEAARSFDLSELKLGITGDRAISRKGDTFDDYGGEWLDVEPDELPKEPPGPPPPRPPDASFSRLKVGSASAPTRPRSRGQAENIQRYDYKILPDMSSCKRDDGSISLSECITIMSKHVEST